MAYWWGAGFAETLALVLHNDLCSHSSHRLGEESKSTKNSIELNLQCINNDSKYKILLVQAEVCAPHNLCLPAAMLTKLCKLLNYKTNRIISSGAYEQQQS